MNHPLSINKLKNYGVKTISFPKNNYYGCIPSFPQSCLFVGESGRGKTNLISNLLTRKDMYRYFFDYITIFTPNAFDREYQAILKVNNRYKNKYTESVIYDEFDEEILEDWYKDVLADYKKAVKMVNRKQIDHPPKHLLLIDDFADNRSVLNSPVLKRLFFNGRHYGINTWVSVQYIKTVPPSIRSNAMNYLVFGGQTNENMNILVEILASGKIGKREMRQIINMIDERGGYSFLFINKSKLPTDGRYCLNFNEVINII